MRILIISFAALLLTLTGCSEETLLRAELDESGAPAAAPEGPSVGSFAIKGKLGEIVYTAGTASANDLFLMDLELKTVTNLTATLGGLNQMPEWSPDGQALVFSRSPSGNFADLRLWMGVPTADGTFSPFPFIGFPFWCPHVFPTWSPNGQQIAFICGAGNGGWGSLWVATFNGSGWDPMPVIQGPLLGSRPTWWGNDRIILPVMPQGSSQRDLFWTSVPPTPGTQGFLTNTPLLHEDNPWWRDVSGSGDDLVYNVVSNLGEASEASDIFSSSLGVGAGGNPVLSTPAQLTTSGTADYPTWTPLGDAILYVEMAGLDMEVFQMDPNGSKKKNLTNSPKVWELWAKRRPAP